LDVAGGQQVFDVSGGDLRARGARRNPLQGHQFLLREGGQQDLGVHVRESLPKVATEVSPPGGGSAPAATQRRRPVDRLASSNLRALRGSQVAVSP
jgi:hypothetical protein